MIATDAQLQQAIEQIERLCRALDSLWRDSLPKNPRNFAVLAQGPVDEIRRCGSVRGRLANGSIDHHVMKVTSIELFVMGEGRVVR